MSSRSNGARLDWFGSSQSFDEIRKQARYRDGVAQFCAFMKGIQIVVEYPGTWKEHYSGIDRAKAKAAGFAFNYGGKVPQPMTAKDIEALIDQYTAVLKQYSDPKLGREYSLDEMLKELKGPK